MALSEYMLPLGMSDPSAGSKMLYPRSIYFELDQIFLTMLKYHANLLDQISLFNLTPPNKNTSII